MLRLTIRCSEMWGTFSKIGRCSVVNSYRYPSIYMRLKSDLAINLETSELGGDLKVKPDRRYSFVNDIFAGMYDASVLAYPEVLEPDTLKSLEARVKLVEAFFGRQVDSCKIDLDKCIPEDTVEGLRKLGLFGIRAPSSCCGLNLSATEYARLKEVIAKDSSIAELLRVHEGLGIQSILLMCDSIPNTDYLQELASGKVFAALCLSENDDPADLNSIMTTAELSKDGEMWRLNGTKKWVDGGSSAGIFIVVARTGKDNELSVFMVERKSEGVSVTPPVHKMGARGISMSKVHFENTPVPAKNVLCASNLGRQLLVELLSADMYCCGGSGTTLLKNLLKLVVEHSISKEYFGRKLRDFVTVQKRVSDICCRMYAMESLTYLTAGILDTHYFADCINESSIVKIFSSENVLRSIDDCQELFGNDAFVHGFPYEQLFRDARASTVPEESNGSMRISIAIRGLEHALFNYPAQNLKPFKRFYERRCQEKDRPLLNLKLYQYVHPTMEVQAKQLEYCIKRFYYALEVLLQRHQERIINHQIELHRLSEFVINIYAMTAVIGRASRSYCIGLLNSDYEVLLAAAFCSHALREVKHTMNDILYGPVATSDSDHMKITRKIIDCKRYFPTNPYMSNL